MSHLRGGIVFKRRSSTIELFVPQVSNEKSHRKWWLISTIRIRACLYSSFCADIPKTKDQTEQTMEK